MALVRVELHLPTARLHLVEPIPAMAAQQTNERLPSPRAASQRRASDLDTTLGQFFGVLDGLLPGLRRLQPGLLEDVSAVVLHLAIAVRRQSIKLAALSGRFVAIGIEDVFWDIAENVFLEFRILIEIGLKIFQRSFGNELRYEIVIVDDNVVAVGLRAHGDGGLWEKIANRFRKDLNVDVRKFLFK